MLHFAIIKSKNFIQSTTNFISQMKWQNNSGGMMTQNIKSKIKLSVKQNITKTSSRRKIIWFFLFTLTLFLWIWFLYSADN